MPENRDNKRTPMALAAGLVLLALATSLAPPVAAQQPASPPSTSPRGGQADSTTTGPVLPRGKKLVLKDGSFQLVREYQVEGDRVRYYSLDSSQWEQMPADLVDWDATKKLEAEEAQRDAAVVSKVHRQEDLRRGEMVDIDASLEAAPGVFLPPGAGLFVFDGHGVFPLTQAEINSKLSKGHFLEQVLVPVPIVPTRHNISIKGERATLRVRNGQPEFYMRTADAREPELVLIRAKVHAGSREIEHVDELFGEQAESANTVSMRRWDVAGGVYRFTLGQPLAAGEYAVAEVVRDQGVSLYVWDFGVDGGAAPSAKPN
jgi:hypothetical protein